MRLWLPSKLVAASASPLSAYLPSEFEFTAETLWLESEFDLRHRCPVEEFIGQIGDAIHMAAGIGRMVHREADAAFKAVAFVKPDFGTVAVGEAVEVDRREDELRLRGERPAAAERWRKSGFLVKNRCPLSRILL